ncbi:unnamed protein product [Blepharisma stoltei]|uniref:Uncharacterized protein n=1 Tax=Blepharisma stoltei TaxID=1481888 RepID=A0AAU9IWA3_9CILI|nr:unnamed protein product [Blepharisma stoltei]
MQFSLANIYGSENPKLFVEAAFLWMDRILNKQCQFSYDQLNSKNQSLYPALVVIFGVCYRHLLFSLTNIYGLKSPKLFVKVAFCERIEF